ncbi:MAG: acyl-CoA dehydrogenase family protein [Pseudomonadales bacterium]
MIDQREMLGNVERFTQLCVAPYAEHWESEKSMPREIFQQAGTYGLTRIIVPEDHGGLGASVLGLAQVLWKIASVDMACAFALVVHNNLAAAIARSDNEYLITEILPSLLNGDKIGAFLLTEPQGGSDAAAIATYAEKRGGEYIVNGEKAWVSNGLHADILSVYAQTENGMLALVIPAETTGIERLPIYSLLGGHALGTAGFKFDDVRVPLENLLVREGDGLNAALAGIDVARINVAAMCCGMLEASLEYAIDYAKGRRFKDTAITSMQGMQWRFADIATDLAAADALFVRAATTLDETGSSPVLAAKAKKFATTVAVKRIAECMQSMGAPGLLQAHPLARHLAFAKMSEYLDGTTEIQNIVIARSLLNS